MKLQTALLAAVGLLVFHPFPASAADPILDIGIAKNDRIVDSSRLKRKLETAGASVYEKEGFAALSRYGAIKVPFKDGDPFFEGKKTTWMLRCKFDDLLYSSSYTIAGRWDHGTDDRIIAFTISPEKGGHPRFHVASQGTLDSSQAVVLKEGIMAGTWITIVGRYKPGLELSVQAFDEDGGEIGSAVMRSGIPSRLFESDIPFSLGGPKGVGMQFTRFRAWDSVLSDQEVVAAVTGSE